MLSPCPSLPSTSLTTLILVLSLSPITALAESIGPAASTSRVCARQHGSPWETMSRPTHPRRSCWPETIRCRASPPPPRPSFLRHTALAIPHLASSATDASTATSGDRRPGGRPPPDVTPVPRLLSILPSRESIKAGYPLQIRFFVGLWA